MLGCYLRGKLTYCIENEVRKRVGTKELVRVKIKKVEDGSDMWRMQGEIILNQVYHAKVKECTIRSWWETVTDISDIDRNLERIISYCDWETTHGLIKYSQSQRISIKENVKKFGINKPNWCELSCLMSLHAFLIILIKCNKVAFNKITYKDVFFYPFPKYQHNKNKEVIKSQINEAQMIKK